MREKPVAWEASKSQHLYCWGTVCVHLMDRDACSDYRCRSWNNYRLGMFTIETREHNRPNMLVTVRQTCQYNVNYSVLVLILCDVKCIPLPSIHVCVHVCMRACMYACVQVDSVHAFVCACLHASVCVCLHRSVVCIVMAWGQGSPVNWNKGNRKEVMWVALYNCHSPFVITVSFFISPFLPPSLVFLFWSLH